MATDENGAKSCKDIIYSDEYFDLITEIPGDVEIIGQYLEIGCVQPINQWQSIVHVKINGNLFTFAGQFPYRNIPKCYGLLDTSNVEDVGVLKLRRRPYIDLYGRDVLIAFMDTGIDYLHPVFRNADNTSRIVGIWDQTNPQGPTPGEGFLYGTYYSNEDINRALASENPYDIVPSLDESGHGTFLAGIAAGNVDEENDFTGIAPQAKIIVVKLKQAKNNLRQYFGIPEDAVCFQESDVLLAVNYSISEAIRSVNPVVFCLGIGTNQGDHNGNSILGIMLGSLGFFSGLSSVIAAGNETNQRHHFYGTMTEEEDYQDIELEVGSNERSFSMELWAGIPLLYSIGIISPEGEFSNRIPDRMGQNERVSFLFEKTEIYVKYEIIETGSGDELILISFQNPAPGIWRIRVFNDRHTNGEFHMWLPMREFISDQTFFIRPNPYTTICEPGNRENIITMAAYNHKNNSIYGDSSRGYTRSGDIKPVLTAPGVNIFGPTPGGEFGVRTGTSVSAAHAAGICALMLEWGLVEENRTRMSSIDIERLLIRGAREEGRETPNREWGYGIIDISETFEKMRTTI